MAVVITASWVATGASATAAPPAPASATDIAAAIGLAQTSRSWSVNVGDYDVDGDDDLMYVLHNETRSKLYRNDDGRFTDVFAGTFRRQDRHDCAWGDANADGRPDLYCSLGASRGTDTNPKELWIQQATGGFVERAPDFGVTDIYGRGRAATFLDVNGDPYPDLFAGNQYPRPDGHPVPNRLYLNDGGNGFISVPGYGVDVEVGGACAQAADVDGDGWEDLLVCGQTGLHLYRNVAGERFDEVTSAWGLATVATGTHHARLADVTGDGKLDVAVVTPTSLRVFPQGDGRFYPASYTLSLRAGRWVAAADFQGDGAVDLFVVQQCWNGVNEPDHLLLGDGSGTSFTAIPTPHADSGCGDVVEAIDRNGDGRDEFIVANGLETVTGPLQVISSTPAPEPPPDPCTISGTSAGEVMDGTAGEDVICAGGGNDTVFGNGGNDTLIGGDGSDVLHGGDGNDAVDAGAGNDRSHPGLGDDEISGNVGRDIAVFNASTQPVSVDLATESATGQGTDTLVGIEVVQGSAGSDTITGSGGAETLNGLGGNDRITGAGGADSLLGGGGADSIFGVDGVEGNDTLDGKAGVDTCTGDPRDALISC